jgi:Tfp pilus assembly PilM family ATPase
MTVSPSGKMLAMEISPRVIRVVEFHPGTTPVQILRVASMMRPAAEPAAAGQAIRAFLAENGFTAKRALVSFSGPLIEHRIYALPPAAQEAREELLRGKVAQEVSTPIGEIRVSGEVIGKVMEGGVERLEVLAAFTPEFEVRRLIFLLIEAGISPARVASAPLALAALHPEDQKDVLAGFLHVEPDRCVIGISDGGKLRFSREFTLELPHRAAVAPEMPEPMEYRTVDFGEESQPPSPPGPSEEEAVAERLVTDLTRSLLYFRQLSRGGSITRLYWSGEPPSPEVTKLIGARLKLEISPHPAGSAAEYGKDLPGSAAEFGVPIGLAVAGQFPEQINLLPEGYIRKRRRRKSYLAAGVVLAVFLVANIVLFAGLQNARNRYRETLNGVAVAAQHSVGMREGFSRWLALRGAKEEVVAEERALRTPFTRWKPLFAALGAPVPAEMMFTTLSIDRSGEGYQCELRAKARGKNPSEAQDRINKFLGDMQSRGGLSFASYAPFEVRPLRKEEGTGYVQEFIVTFRLAPDREEAAK